MYTLNGVNIQTDFGIQAGRIDGEHLAVKGIFDMPKRIGVTERSWDDLDTLEPYVDADELFFAGRTIYFAGLLIGEKNTVENQLEAFQSFVKSLANYNTVVPFATPYGTFCCYVKKATSKLYNYGATILVELQEPVVGATCSVAGGGNIYYSAAYSDTAVKNDCASGYYGSTVTLTAQAEKFTSTISQAVADQLAVNWVKANKQGYANANGTCIINPTTYYNVKLTAQLQKNDCASGYTGSMVTVEVAADKYSSIISQADANAKAQAEIDALLTQAYANANGTCIVDEFSTMQLVSNDGVFGGVRVQIMQIGASIKVGAIYHLILYGVEINYTAQALDTAADIVQALVALVNAKTAITWNEKYAAPSSGTVGFPPTASVGVTADTIRLELNYENSFFGWVTN